MWRGLTRRIEPSDRRGRAARSLGRPGVLAFVFRSVNRTSTDTTIERRPQGVALRVFTQRDAMTCSGCTRM